MSELKHTVSSWSLKASNHGLAKIAQSDGKSKTIIWATLFLTSLLICIYGIYYDIIYYFEYKTRTNVNIVNEISSEIPTISICPYMNIEANTAIYPNLELLDCEIKQNQYLEVLKCGLQDFYQNINFCLTFNTTSIANALNVTHETNDIAFKLVIKKPDDEKYKFFVSIHDKRIFPFKINGDKHHLPFNKCSFKPIIRSFSISTRLIFNIKSRMYYHKLSYPYSNCVDNWNTIDKQILNIMITKNFTNTDYDEENCYIVCLQAYKNFTKICDHLCPPKCNSVTYIINEATFCDYEISTENTVTLGVHFNDLIYTDIQEVPAVTSSELLGSIGLVL